jgi:glucose-6-phosphate isomerase
MESNGKRVTTSGEPLDYFVGEVDFGEPGTTGQHSFFQLMHMGQVALALPLTPNPQPQPQPQP